MSRGFCYLRSASGGRGSSITLGCCWAFCNCFCHAFGGFFLVDLNCDKRKLRCNMAFYVFLVSMHNIQ